MCSLIPSQVIRLNNLLIRLNLYISLIIIIHSYALFLCNADNVLNLTDKLFKIIIKVEFICGEHNKENKFVKTVKDKSNAWVEEMNVRDHGLVDRCGNS